MTPLSGTTSAILWAGVVNAVKGGIGGAGGLTAAVGDSTFERDLKENFCLGARSFLTLANSSERPLSC